MARRCKIGISALAEMLAGMGIPILTEILRGPESKFPETEPFFFAHGMCFPRPGTVEREAARRRKT